MAINSGKTVIQKKTEDQDMGLFLTLFVDNKVNFLVASGFKDICDRWEAAKPDDPLFNEIPDDVSPEQLVEMMASKAMQFKIDVSGEKKKAAMLRVVEKLLRIKREQVVSHQLFQNSTDEMLEGISAIMAQADHSVNSEPISASNEAITQEENIMTQVNQNQTPATPVAAPAEVNHFNAIAVQLANEIEARQKKAEEAKKTELKETAKKVGYGILGAGAAFLGIKHVALPYAQDHGWIGSRDQEEPVAALRKIFG